MTLKQLRVRVHGHTWGTHSSSNSVTEHGWFIRILPQIRTKWVASLEGRSSGMILWRKMTRISWASSLKVTLMEEDRRGRRRAAERESLSWGGIEREEEGEGVIA